MKPDRSSNAMDANQPVAPPVPHSFLQYLRSLGPGIVMVLTWLGGGNVVNSSVAGANYGYALMWIVVIALGMRFLFVSLIAKYQLCNEQGEGVLDGLTRLHRWYAPFLALVAVVLGHIYGSYMLAGIGETCVNVTGRGLAWHWAAFWALIALVTIFRPSFRRVELVFKGILVLLSVSLLGTAIWAGPSPSGILRGVLAFELPARAGGFDALLVVIAMIGALGGSIANLIYPYFLEQKGWRGPQYRRVQMYDFFLAILTLIIFTLAIWTIGAELLHARGDEIKKLDDVTKLLGVALGEGGKLLFYLGVFSILYTSVVGHGLGLGCLATHGYLRWRRGPGELPDYKTHPIYKWAVTWIVISPVVWSLPGMPDFVTLTLVANSLQVVLIPVLVGGVWWITASSRYIGARYRNRWWENAVMVIVFIVALWAAWGSVTSVIKAMRELL
ncbi:MAG: divalent metal cation transporter [Verrucomicrobia bacterium]|nr:divalent metal cation transporter [Verrucomicrobiota bacterium]